MPNELHEAAKKIETKEEMHPQQKSTSVPPVKITGSSPFSAPSTYTLPGVFNLPPTPCNFLPAPNATSITHITQKSAQDFLKDQLVASQRERINQYEKQVTVLAGQVKKLAAPRSFPPAPNAIPIATQKPAQGLQSITFQYEQMKQLNNQLTVFANRVATLETEKSNQQRVIASQQREIARLKALLAKQQTPKAPGTSISRQPWTPNHFPVSSTSSSASDVEFSGSNNEGKNLQEKDSQTKHKKRSIGEDAEMPNLKR